MNNPSKVEDRYLYWGSPPPELSPRCIYWLNRIASGFRPNRRIRSEGYDSSSQYYGVYIWEYINMLAPVIDHLTSRDKI